MAGSRCRAVTERRPALPQQVQPGRVGPGARAWTRAAPAHGCGRPSRPRESARARQPLQIGPRGRDPGTRTRGDRVRGRRGRSLSPAREPSSQSRQLQSIGGAVETRRDLRGLPSFRQGLSAHGSGSVQADAQHKITRRHPTDDDRHRACTRIATITASLPTQGPPASLFSNRHLPASSR